jgi:excisionase family DNA binding protein
VRQNGVPVAGLLSVKAAAARLQVKPGVIYAAVERGLLRCYRVRSEPASRGVIRISEEQLQEYLIAHGTTAEVSKPARRKGRLPQLELW